MATVEGAGAWRGVGGQSVGVGSGNVDRAGAGASVALVAAWVADEAAHGVDRKKVALEPALHPLLLVLDGVPGEEDEEEAEELQARGEAEVDKAQRGDVVLPAGAVDATVLLPQHAGGVDDGTEVNGCRNVGWVRRKMGEEGEREEGTDRWTKNERGKKFGSINQ